MSNCCVGSVRGDVVIDMLNESRYGEYETLLRNLAEDNEIEFGPNDPKTLHALNILAVILARKKKDAESESIYREVIKICTKVEEKEGENSVYNACKSTAQNNLGCLLISRKDIYESSRLFNEASTLRVGVSGAVGTHTRDITHNQANVEFMKGNYSLAADLYRNSLHCRSPATTSRNFQTCECERSLADSLQRAGKFADAEAVYKRLLTELDLIVGVGHIYSSKCRNQLASALLHQDKLEEAEAVLRDNLSIAESNLEVGDTTKTSALYILKLKSKLAALLVKQKKYDFAEKMYSEALSPDMPETYDALAVCLIQQGKLTEASQFYTTVLESRESSLGPDHPQTIHAVCIFGDLHLRANNFLAALASFRRALCVYERELGSENILTLTAVDNVGAISEKLDLLPEAECMLSRALAGYEKLLGKASSLPNYCISYCCSSSV